MSTLYNLEPQPTAQVLLETTSGDILLELFAKQTPLASRNFLQLCLDGYYDGTVFHRLVSGFVVQGGDPTGTGEGGEAIYDGGLFDDEFHSRLKFNRRGLLGMANSGRKNDNGSQFFLTLGATPELDGRNTMFGRVVGDTIYNMIKMGEAELVDCGGERPLYPTQIKSTEVLVNPFEGMLRREHSQKVGGLEDVRSKKKGKKKAAKTLLSFRPEGDEEEEVVIPKKGKFNIMLDEGGRGAAHTKEDNHARSAEKLTQKIFRRNESGSISPASIQKPNQGSKPPLLNDEEVSRSPSISPDPPVIAKVTTLLEQTNAQIADMKASMKRNVMSAPKTEVQKKSALERMIPENATRGRKRRRGINGDAPKDAQTLNILNEFRAKLESVPPDAEAIHSINNALPNDQQINGGTDLTQDYGEAELCDLHFIVNCQSCSSWDKEMHEKSETTHDDGKGWMSHTLNFDKDRLGKDLSWKRKAEEELVVIDPKERIKDIMEERRVKKAAKISGSSGRVWDRDRERPKGFPEKA